MKQKMQYDFPKGGFALHRRPRLHAQTRNPLKFPLVAGYYGCVHRQGVRGDQSVQRSNRATGPLQRRSKPAIGRRGVIVKRRDFQCRAEVDYGALVSLRIGASEYSVLKFCQGDYREANLIQVAPRDPATAATIAVAQQAHADVCIQHEADHRRRLRRGREGWRRSARKSSVAWPSEPASSCIRSRGSKRITIEPMRLMQTSSPWKRNSLGNRTA